MPPLPSSRRPERRPEGAPAAIRESFGRRSPSIALGRAGEKAAAELMRQRGYEVVGAGFTARRGELDLICRRGRDLVVVEVKTRTSDAFGTPQEAVSARKRRALAAAVAEYRLLAGWRGPIRYAVVAMMHRPDGGFDADLIEDPFE